MLHSKLHAWLGYKRGKADEVSSPVCVVVKAVMNCIEIRSMEISKRNTILETRLSDTSEYNKAVEEIRNKVTRMSLGSQNQHAVPAPDVSQTARDDFALIMQ